MLLFETTVTAPARAVFAFFEDPANLPAAYGGRAVRVLHHDGTVRPGAATWVEVTVLGILSVVMGFEHVVYEPPCAFAERLIHGPFSRFEHRHEFEQTARGTVVRDRVDVEVSRSYGGRPATMLVAGPLIRRMFADRAKALAGLDKAGKLNGETPETW